LRRAAGPQRGSSSSARRRAPDLCCARLGLCGSRSDSTSCALGRHGGALVLCVGADLGWAARANLAAARASAWRCARRSVRPQELCPGRPSARRTAPRVPVQRAGSVAGGSTRGLRPRAGAAPRARRPRCGRSAQQPARRARVLMPRRIIAGRSSGTPISWCACIMPFGSLIVPSLLRALRHTSMARTGPCRRGPGPPARDGPGPRRLIGRDVDVRARTCAGVVRRYWNVSFRRLHPPPCAVKSSRSQLSITFCRLFPLDVRTPPCRLPILRMTGSSPHHRSLVTTGGAVWSARWPFPRLSPLTLRRAGRERGAHRRTGEVRRLRTPMGRGPSPRARLQAPGASLSPLAPKLVPSRTARPSRRSPPPAASGRRIAHPCMASFARRTPSALSLRVCPSKSLHRRRLYSPPAAAPRAAASPPRLHDPPQRARALTVAPPGSTRRKARLAAQWGSHLRPGCS